jgi:hypothetical protein
MKSAMLLLGSIVLFSVVTAYTQSTTILNLTAKSANVSEANTPVRINILRWSTDEENLPLLAALNPALAPAPAAGARGARGGRGRGAQSPDDVAPDPALAEVDGGGGARGGRGGGRGGRGGRGGGDAAPVKPPEPIDNLTAAIGKAPTVGYIWTNEVVGYSIKYAHRMEMPGGGQRIILATDRRLGAYNNAWKPTGSATPTAYEFTLVELRLDAKGLGEGRTSLTGKVVIDNDAKILALENYGTTPVTLATVK